MFHPNVTIVYRERDVNELKTPQWIHDALKKRFDDLSFKFQSSHDIMQLQARSAFLLEQIVCTTEPKIYKLFQEWEAETSSFNAMQSEWLYMKGIQDGLELLTLQFQINESEGIK